MTKEFHIAGHIFPALTDQHLVLLDIHADSYILAGPDEKKVLENIIKNSAPQPGKTLTGLLEQNILTTDLDCALRTDGLRSPLSVEYLPAQNERMRYSLDQQHAKKTGNILKLLWASAQTLMMRRFLPFHKMLEVVGKRKQKNHHDTVETGSSKDIEDLLDFFRRYRVLFYTPKDHCLFDSLCLINFLALFDIFPDWVFAVRMGPFEAHCWVQYKQDIYNDTLAHCGNFAPILLL